MPTKIDKVQLDLGRMQASMRQRVRGGRQKTALDEAVQQKSFGEKPPERADISNDPFLEHLFSERGLVGWLGQKIVLASKHPGEIVPAHDITAMAMPHLPGKQDGNLVFLGTEFACEKCNDPDLLAGVLCHEWGHLTSDFLCGLSPNGMNWEEVHALRKEEEAYADAYAGRLLYLIGHKPEGLIRHFLARSPEQESAKYHDVATREAIIWEAWEAQQRAQQTAAKLLHGPDEKSQLTARIIAIA